MTLDLATVSRQIEAMGAPMVEAGRVRRELLRRALEALAALEGRGEELRSRVEERHPSLIFPVAGITDDPGRRFPPLAAPADYGVLAVDGSQIATEHHDPLSCFLINVGSVVLRYGGQPDARLGSCPQIYYREEELYIPHPSDPDRRKRIAGALLAARRDVEECAGLARLVGGLPSGQPALALLDNSLILWGLMGRRFEDWLKEHLLGQYFRHLDTMQVASADRPLAMAGYISRPDGANVVNTLRLSLCRQPDCSRCKGLAPGRRDCDPLAGLTDRELFAAFLVEPGERSALFMHLVGTAPDDSSDPVEAFYRGKEVHFFYLNTGEEIARVEVPRWVAEGPGLVDLAHKLVYDQVRRGLGYPVALAEAHEQAVVSGAERDQFWYLVETMAAEQGLDFAASAKAVTKRTRGV